MVIYSEYFDCFILQPSQGVGTNIFTNIYRIKNPQDTGRQIEMESEASTERTRPPKQPQ